MCRNILLADMLKRGIARLMSAVTKQRPVHPMRRMQLFPRMTVVDRQHAASRGKPPGRLSIPAKRVQTRFEPLTFPLRQIFRSI